MAGPLCGGCGRFSRDGYRPGECRPCWNWYANTKFLRLWGPCPFGTKDPVIATEKARRKKRSQPMTVRTDNTAAATCRFFGLPLTVEELKKAGLGPTRQWRHCGLGLAKNPGGLPGIVCICTGCGPECEGYEAKDKSQTGNET